MQTLTTARSDDELLLPAPVLIVEDEAPAQERCAQVLAALGYTANMLVFTTTIAQARLHVAEQAFAMVLVDIGLPDGHGVDLIRELHRHDAALPILVVSGWRTEQTVVAALQAGAIGYLLKEREPAEMLLSIRSALRGGAPIDPFVAKRILELIGPAPAPNASASPLTARELEILTLVSKGLTNREIGEVLVLSKLTVGCHIRNIYKKLAVGSRTQAVFEARSSGWLP